MARGMHDFQKGNLIMEIETTGVDQFLIAAILQDALKTML